MIAGGRLSSLEGMLAGDHDRLDRLFEAIIRRAHRGAFEEIEVAWLEFQNALLGHLDAEEKHVIPELARDRPREAQVLLNEHAQIRIQLLRLGVDLDLRRLPTERAEAFVNVLRAHAEREEHIFYPWVDRQSEG